MSVTILPYIKETKTASVSSSTAAGKSSAATAGSQTEFREILEAEKRAREAMAVDAMIAESKSGGVSGDAIQKLLGFRPQAVAGSDISSTASAGSVSGPTASKDSASSAGAASGTANSSDTASRSSAAKTTDTGTSTTASSKTVRGCPAELEDDFKEAAATYGVDVNLLKAVAKAESGFNASATSSAGAMGVMQLMPSTAKSLGISDAYNAHDNIMGGARVLSQNLDRYDGDISLALAGYNAGCGNVDKYGGIPPFKETQNYVKKVLNYYNGF